MSRSEFLSLLSTLAEMSDDSDVEAMLEAPFMKEGAEVGRLMFLGRPPFWYVHIHALRCHMTCYNA